MQVVSGFVFVLLILLPTGVTWSAEHDSRLIVPSERIGTAHLGMTRSMIEEMNRTSSCPVVATYDASGRSAALATNWGGGCIVSDKIQVGLPFGPAMRVFGKPDRITFDTRYPHATAVWVVYQDRGIAFRVLGWHSGTTIQTIAVFAGLAAQASGHVRATPLVGAPVP